MAKAASEEVRRAARALRVELLRDLGRHDEAEALASQPLISPAEPSSESSPQVSPELIERAVRAASAKAWRHTSAFGRTYRPFQNPFMIEKHPPGMFWPVEPTNLHTFSLVVFNASESQVTRVVRELAQDDEVEVIDLLDARIAHVRPAIEPYAGDVD